MNIIYKYKLELGEVDQITMPEKANILQIGAQHGSLWIWALVDTDNPDETRTFRLYGTGHEIEDLKNLQYIGTVSVMEGRLVLHVFEEL